MANKRNLIISAFFTLLVGALIASSYIFITGIVKKQFRAGNPGQMQTPGAGGCSQLPPEQRGSCLGQLSAYNVENCGASADPDQCYMLAAKMKNDRSWCEKINDAGRRDKCLSTFNCEEARWKITAMLSEINHCRIDDDCETINLGCPFGCYSLANKTSPVGEIDRLLEEYRRTCPRCVYRCMAPSQGGSIKCLDGKCADIRLGSPEQD